MSKEPVILEESPEPEIAVHEVKKIRLCERRDEEDRKGEDEE